MSSTILPSLLLPNSVGPSHPSTLWHHTELAKSLTSDWEVSYYAGTGPSRWEKSIMPAIKQAAKDYQKERTSGPGGGGGEIRSDSAKWIHALLNEVDGRGWRFVHLLAAGPHPSIQLNLLRSGFETLEEDGGSTGVATDAATILDRHTKGLYRIAARYIKLLQLVSQLGVDLRVEVALPQTNSSDTTTVVVPLSSCHDEFAFASGAPLLGYTPLMLAVRYNWMHTALWLLDTITSGGTNSSSRPSHNSNHAPTSTQATGNTQTDLGGYGGGIASLWRSSPCVSGIDDPLTLAKSAFRARDHFENPWYRYHLDHMEANMQSSWKSAITPEQIRQWLNRVHFTKSSERRQEEQQPQPQLAGSGALLLNEKNWPGMNLLPFPTLSVPSSFIGQWSCGELAYAVLLPSPISVAIARSSIEGCHGGNYTRPHLEWYLSYIHAEWSARIVSELVWIGSSSAILHVHQHQHSPPHGASPSGASSSLNPGQSLPSDLPRFLRELLANQTDADSTSTIYAGVCNGEMRRYLRANLLVAYMSRPAQQAVKPAARIPAVLWHYTNQFL